MSNDKSKILKQLPSVDKVLQNSSIKELLLRYPRTLVAQQIRQTLQSIRKEILENDDVRELSFDEVITMILEEAKTSLQNSLKRGINGVGVILHTNMGRAPFAPEAQEALMDTIAHYSTLEISTETGRRGRRDSHIEELLKEITGAEAATIVNNNAAATLLILNTLAKEKEVIVSRGELVEIGGAFRIPDVMEQSGAILREVGTTNRTHLKDYVGAIDEELTGALLHVHKSNYYISGFTKEVPLKEIAEAAHSHGLPFFDDLGSGALVNLEKWGLPHEPTVQDSLKAGADVVCFSGDKLIGGPQAGIIVGKKEIVDKIRQNQLFRALRCDKMTYSVLEGTLRLFLDEEKLLANHPVLRMLTEDIEEVKKRAQSLKRRLTVECEERLQIRIKEDESEVGSGSLSWAAIPTIALAITLEGTTAEELAAKLRSSNPPIFSRIKNGELLLDCRTILHSEARFILQAFKEILTIE